MKTDIWHYPRIILAQHVFTIIESGLANALTFFAPRRMGKTEFLCKDIAPLAEKHHWKVFYFSFLDVGATAAGEFTRTLALFAEKAGTQAKTRGLLQKISKVSGETLGIKAAIEFNDPATASANLKELIANLATKNNVLLLLDEVQILAQYPANANFIAALRTSLDIHKDTIKIIFTGSSQEGLRRMFSQAKAPFFHFGQNLRLPELDQGFTDHLAKAFTQVTNRKLDPEALWLTFQEMQKIPQLARGLVERLALNPNLTLEQAKKELLADVFSDRAFADVWDKCSALERLLLDETASGVSSLFGIQTREKFTKKLGISKLSVPSVQSAVRVLQRKGLIVRYPERNGYFIDDPNFKNWLLQNKPE